MVHVPEEVTRKLRAQELDKERQLTIRGEAIERYLQAADISQEQFSKDAEEANLRAKKWKNLFRASIIGNFIIAATAAYMITISC